MNRTLLTRILALGTACLAWGTLAVSAEPAVVLYVSPAGQDTWSGRLAEPNSTRSDGPFATVGRARDRLRELAPPGGARVLLRAGTYRLTKPLQFGPEDSGTADAPRSYESFPGETAVLSGTQVVSGPWRKVDGSVYATALDQHAPGAFRTLFVDGRRATWARYPNEGFLYATGGQGKTVIEVAAGVAKPSWATDPTATVNIIAERGWYNQILRLAGVGENGASLNLAGRETVGRILEGNRFYIEGVRAELDQDGEWYLDRSTRTLYVFSNEPPERHRFENSTVDRLIELRGRVGQPVRHLAFRGLGLFGSDFTVDHVAVRTNQDAALHLINAHDVEIAGCRFEAVGGYAVWLHLDSRGNVIRQNEIVDGGAGGVLLTGPRFSYLSDSDIFDASPEVQNVAPVGNVILGNHIHRGGAVRAYCSGVHLDSRPLSLAQAQGNYVGFNHIHTMPRNGIFAFRNQGGNIFEANTIHDVLQRTNDGGAVHLASMNPLCSPTHIVDNRIFRIGYPGREPRVRILSGSYPDSSAPAEVMYTSPTTNMRLSFGIYPDWFTSHMLIRGNVVTDTRDGGIRLLGGDDAVIEDNLVGDDPMASVVFGHWTTQSVRGIVLRNNRVVNGRGDWVRFYTGDSPRTIAAVIADPQQSWSSSGNTYWGRTTGGGIVIAKGARGPLLPGERRLSLPEIQRAGGELGSTESDFGADGSLDISIQPDAFGRGSETFRRMQSPRSVEDARRWLQQLEGTASFVPYDEPLRVVYGGDWQVQPTKITDFLAFADLKQAAAHTAGSAISFETELRPDGPYDVFLKWYGSPSGRAATIEVELVVPGGAGQTLRVDHQQEGHKWVKIGSVAPRNAGSSKVTLRNPGGGMTAINSVAWVRQPAP
jgi:hypothetical protein